MKIIPQIAEDKVCRHVVETELNPLESHVPSGSGQIHLSAD
jgi:hypothetical protein